MGTVAAYYWKGKAQRGFSSYRVPLWFYCSKRSSSWIHHGGGLNYEENLRAAFYANAAIGRA